MEGRRKDELQADRGAVNRLSFTYFDELAALSSRGVNGVVPDTGHDIPTTQPRAINSEILEIISIVSKPNWGSLPFLRNVRFGSKAATLRATGSPTSALGQDRTHRPQS